MCTKVRPGQLIGLESLGKSIGFVWGRRQDSPRNVRAEVRFNLHNFLAELPKAVTP
jgi:hypothetical protein